MTYEQALAEAKKQMGTVGVGGIPDPNYVKTLMTGQDAGYTQGILDANKRQPSVVVGTTPVDPQKQLADTIKNRKLSALEQAYQKNLGALEAEKTAIDPAFAGQTRQAVTQAEMGKKSFADFLAEKGLASSGLAGQGEISQNIALQGQLGGIETQRSNALADIERRRTGLGQDLAYGQQQTEMDIAQQELENKIRQDEQLASEKKVQEADIKNQFLDTITRFANDYMSQISKVRNDGDPSNDWQIPYLETARQDKIARGGLDQMGRPLVAPIQELTNAEAIARWKAVGFADEAVAKALGVPVGSQPYTKPKSTGGGSSDDVDYNKLIQNDL